MIKRLPKLLLSLWFLSFLSCTMMNDNPLVIGHRGAMGYETENTLASVQKALDLNVDMIEIDVFKIESGEIVVFHDEKVDRLANGGGAIESYNLLDLRKLILDGNHKIPLLQDVLKLIDHKVPLNIELKGANTAEEVNAIMSYYIKEKGWSTDDFLISSFNWDELRKMRKLNDTVAIAVLTEEDPKDAIPLAQELVAVAINPNFALLTQDNINIVHDAGFKVYTWTVNEEQDIMKAKRMGVDGIFTNYPDRIH
ncbi:glycerophosphodiester phosphodiesterase [Spongiimicrobium salis]|uniref:glycerophosphodiester phosphodiesterase n=1 Tax=Spongiimicrobium salis TaxID=1667022 RepID=UPI00374CDC01